MIEYEIVKIGKTHYLGDEIISQDVMEIYPLDVFFFTWDYAIELYKYIKGVDNRLTGAFPICKFDDGVYIGVVGVLGIQTDAKGKETVGISIDPECLQIADYYCSIAYNNEDSKVQNWAKVMSIVDECDIFDDVVDFINDRIFCDC